MMEELKKRIKEAQFRALKAGNQELLMIYSLIGKILAEAQPDNLEEGVRSLAKELQNAFPKMSGFSERNLWRMRDFYLAYRNDEKMAKLISEVSWTHHLVILEKCKDPLAREYYIRMSKIQGWSYQVLMNQIDNKNYEKSLLYQNKPDKSLAKLSRDARVSIQDGYVFDFLERGSFYREQEFKYAILSKMEEFLREMGNAYSFMGSQYRLTVGDQEFFIDLLLYHRGLKSLVAIEVKMGAFMPEYVGKMQFYLAVLDDTVRLEGENPPIGMIICKEKDRTSVEYALKGTQHPIQVAAYQQQSSFPEKLLLALPSPKQIEKLLELIE